MFFDKQTVLNKRVLAAVSGGADSVALLLLLNDMFRKGEIDLLCAHYEHGIRGSESLEDAEFVKKLCEKYDIPVVCGKANVPLIAEKTHEGLESCARRLRHAFLNETAAIYDCDCIATAHHADDQAETVLMHLLRGTGPEGIKGIEAVSGNLVRPLIGARKNEIYDYLKSVDQDWREDSTNLINDNPRNIIRNEVIPAFEKAYPACVNAINRYAVSASRESEFISKLADEFFEKNTAYHTHAISIDLEGEEVLLRRAIRKVLGRDLTGAKLDEIISSVSAVEVFDGIRTERYNGRLYITFPFEKPYPAFFVHDGMSEIYSIARFESVECEPVPEKNDRFVQVLNKEALENAIVRTREDGDYITPFGMSGTKSLSDYFTDMKYPRPLRDTVPLIARGSEILWAAGCGISDKCRVKSGDAAVKVTCIPEKVAFLRP